MTDIEKIKFIEDAILHLLKKPVKLKSTDILLDLGVDSLETVELQMYYEETTGHEIEADVTVSTVGDLMAVMR
jgi:acyl carrier protein